MENLRFVKLSGKKPLQKGWNLPGAGIDYIKGVDLGVHHLDSGTGCLDCDGNPEWLESLDWGEDWPLSHAELLGQCGGWAWSSGKPGRSKILFALPEPLASVAGEGYELRCATPGGKSMQDAIQGGSYAWMGKAPLLPPLPIPPELERAWLRSARKSASTSPQPAGAPLEGERLRLINSAMAYIPADSRGDWIAIGAALYHDSGGDAGAFEIWDTWSRTSSHYKEMDCEGRWGYYGPGAGTIEKSIFHRAAQLGWPEKHEKALSAMKDLVAPESPVPDFPEPVPILWKNSASVVVEAKWILANYALVALPGQGKLYLRKADQCLLANRDFGNELEGKLFKIGEKKALGAGMIDILEPAAPTARRVLANQGVPITRTVFTAESAPDEMNLFRGWGVQPRPGDCSRIRQHVAEVIAAGDAVAGEAFLNLLAWQVQNVGTPSRIITIMQSEKQQSGKGRMMDFVLEFAGLAGARTTHADQLLGRFNDILVGKVFIFLDEATFADNHREASALKSISAGTEEAIERKGLPVIQSPVGINLYMATNNERVAAVEAHDRRYWILKIAEHRVADFEYWAALKAEQKAGGAAHFLHFLLDRDVSAFNPQRDLPRQQSEIYQEQLAQTRYRELHPFHWMMYELDCEISLFAQESVRGQALLDAYIEWARRNGSRYEKRVSNSAYGKSLNEAGFRYHRHKTESVTWGIPDRESLRKFLHEALCVKEDY